MAEYGGAYGQMRTLRLSEFTMMVGGAIRSVPALQSAWVTAELSDVRVSGGHCYMELVEKDAAGMTVAKLRATIWANRFYGISQKFRAVTGRDIAAGMKVLLNGGASHHPVYGLSFSVNDIDPAYTLGDMERLRREILERLAREGVIGYNRSLRMACAPQRIAVISAPTAAGYGDFVNQLEGNPDGFVFYDLLFPAIMQGDRTSASVREALDRIEMAVDFWDCVVIIRGGGSTTDLNGFDDYDLARRVATYPLPVVVGIGHERDRTVLDEIANVRMKTPTAVAAFFIDCLRTAYTDASSRVTDIVRYCTERLTGESRRLSNLEAMIAPLAGARVASARAALESVAGRLPALAATRLATARERLAASSRMLGAVAASRCGMEGRRLDDLSDRIAQAAVVRLQRETQRLDGYRSLIDAFSPAKTLRRGYSITMVDGHAVTDASLLKHGQTITTRLDKGSVESVVASAE